MKRLANALVFAIALALCTSSSDAQQSAKVFRVGVLALGSAEDMQNRLALLREPLRYLGYEEGKNLVIEPCFAHSAYERLPVLAGELHVSNSTCLSPQGNRRCSQRKRRARISQSS
jgi:putative tryptophan/tyrosine transport system substrate-binding protein